MSRRARAVLCFGVLGLAEPSLAVGLSWINPAGGLFQDGTNWDGGLAPGAEDWPIFNLGSASAYTVSFNGSVSNLRLIVGDDKVIWNLGGNSYTITTTDPGATLLGGGTSIFAQDAELTVLNGEIMASGGVRIASSENSTATLRLSGSSATIGGAVVPGAGLSGNGTILLDNGAELSCAAMLIAPAQGGQGTFVVTQSAFRCDHNLVVGEYGPGFMRLESGAVASIGGTTILGWSDGSGSITVASPDARLDSEGELNIGVNGLGRLNVNGGTVTSASGDIGAGTFGIGTALVAGTNARWISSGTLAVGNRGAGTLLIGEAGVGGGTVSSENSTVGRSALSHGFVRVQSGLGVPASWNTGSLSIGKHGAGSLEIRAGGTVTAAGPVHVGEDDGGRGDLLVDGAEARFDATGHYFHVGYAGAGDVRVLNGATVTSGPLTLGAGSTGVASAIISGVGSQWVSSGSIALSLGNGVSSLTIGSGAAVRADSLLLIGPQATVSLNAGTLQATGIINFGRLESGADTSHLFGEVTNTSLGSIHIDNSGSTIFHGQVDHSSGALINITTGATAVFLSGISGPGSFSGGGLKIFRGGSSEVGRIDTTGTTRVEAGASLISDRFREQSLFVGGQVGIRPGNSDASTSRLRILQIEGGATPSGRLDITNNDLVIDYDSTSPLPTIRAQIVSGNAGGTWGGDGITSSAADASHLGVGYGEASAVFTSFPATFSGQTVDESAVLIRFTRYGDANLDGSVNLEDFNRLASNFGLSNAVWTQADFNYDGIVNLSDFNLLAINFGLQAGPDAPTPQDWAALATVMPEPGATSAIGLITALPLWRSARRRGSRLR